jgi:RNA polymerase sigma factor (sigma-70 family)
MKAFEDLYREHAQAVFRFAMSLTGRKESAEDLTSEAFLALYRNLDSIDESRLRCSLGPSPHTPVDQRWALDSRLEVITRIC